MSWRSVTVLLLQARHQDDDARIEERHSFAAAARLPVEQITPFDLLSAAPTMDEIRRHDALMIGGSGDYYVSKGNLPNFALVLERLAAAVTQGQPTFASCFGFQLLVQALGGEIIYDPEGTEVGTYPVTLTSDGQKDPLFHTLPPTFQAQLGRKDRAGRLPDGVIHLAASERCPYQAFRIQGQPVWATQFHPELTKETNLARFRRYLNGYAANMSPADIQATLDRFDHSPAANTLIGRFLRLVFD